MLNKLCSLTAEAKEQQRSESWNDSSVSTHKSLTSLYPVQGPTPVIREGRSTSASCILPAPTKVTAKKSPKTWLRRNALVTPLNGPATVYGEWPLVDFNSLGDFSKLHDYYGQEVKKAREEWLRSRRAEEEHSDEDLIDLM